MLQAVRQATHENRWTSRRSSASDRHLGLCWIAGLGQPAGRLGRCRQLEGPSRHTGIKV